MLKKAIFLIYTLIFTASFLSAQQTTLYDKGLDKYRDGQYLEAIRLFEDHIRLNSSDIKVDDAKWRIGRALVHLDRPMEAEPYYREVSAESGNRQDDASYDLAELLFDTGRSEESLVLFLNFVQVFPESSRNDDAYWYIGEIQLSADNIEKAEASFRTVTENLGSNRRDEALYSLGYLLYTEKRNDEAMETFNVLLTEYPDDIKIDDAMWRIGRIYMRLDQDNLAEAIFQEILELPSSNRYDEALYDLGRIQYYTHRDYAGVIERFSPLPDNGQIGLYQKKSVYLGANAYYALGLQARRQYLDEDASDYFASSIHWFEYLLEKEADDTDRADILIELGKAYDHLIELSLDKDVAMVHTASATAAFLQAAELLEDTAKDDALKRLSDVRRTESPYTKYDVSVLGGYESLVSRPGARVSADVEILFPVGFRQRLSTALSFDHEDLTIKTFNFDPGQSGTDRLISRNDTLALNLGWRSGSSRSFRNDLDVTTSYRLAEDPGDNRFLASVEDTLRWRFGPNWKLDTDISATLKIYPDYLSGSNKIDSFTPAFRPEITFYGIEGMAIDLAYELLVKQYLQATYGGSNKNKQYIINSAAIEFRRPSGLFRPSLQYEFAWLESNNYNLLVSGLPAPQFVNDYWDNITHSIRLDLDFRWTSRFRTELIGKLDYRAFSNYPARDETNTFTGEIRKDLSIELSMDISYVFKEKAYTSVSGVMEARWIQDVSNMLYDNSIATNFQSFGAYLGVQVERR